jgi:hypothetical protein
MVHQESSNMFINDGARLDIFSENMSIGSGFQCEPTGELSLTLMVEVIIFLECNLILSTSSVLIFYRFVEMDEVVEPMRGVADSPCACCWRRHMRSRFQK